MEIPEGQRCQALLPIKRGQPKPQPCPNNAKHAIPAAVDWTGPAYLCPNCFGNLDAVKNGYPIYHQYTIGEDRTLYRKPPKKKTEPYEGWVVYGPRKQPSIAPERFPNFATATYASTVFPETDYESLTVFGKGWEVTVYRSNKIAAITVEACVHEYEQDGCEYTLTDLDPVQTLAMSGVMREAVGLLGYLTALRLPTSCDACLGTGREHAYDHQDQQPYETGDPCPECNGTGVVPKEE